MASEKTTSTGTEAAERVADVLLALSRNDVSIGVSAISRELSLSKAVVHRILQSLVSRDLVRIDPETREYSLGPSATALGARALRQLDLRTVARGELISLRNETQETTTLSLLVSDHRTYIDQFVSAQEIKMTVELGRMYPLHAGASSRAILAFVPEADAARVLRSDLESLTTETIHDRNVLEERLNEIRRNGYATSRGERQSGAGSVAAPVFGSDGRVVGSISVCGPLARFDAETVARDIPLVVASAARISAQLGWDAAPETARGR